MTSADFDKKQNQRLYYHLIKNKNLNVSKQGKDGNILYLSIQISQDREGNNVCMQLIYINNILYSSISTENIIYVNSNFSYTEKYKKIEMRDIKSEMDKIRSACRQYVITDEKKEYLVENNTINKYKNADAVIIEDDKTEKKDATENFKITREIIKQNKANKFALLSVE